MHGFIGGPKCVGVSFSLDADDGITKSVLCSTDHFDLDVYLEYMCVSSGVVIAAVVLLFGFSKFRSHSTSGLPLFFSGLNNTLISGREISGIKLCTVNSN